MSNMGGFRSRHVSHRSTSDRSSVSILPWTNGSVLDNICTVIVVICLILGGLVNAGVIKPSSAQSRDRIVTYTQGSPSSRPSSSGSSQNQQQPTDSAPSDSSDSTGIIGTSMIHATNTVNTSTKSKPCMTSTMPCRQPRSMNMSKRFRTPNQRLIHGSRP